VQLGMCALGQRRTFAPQQRTSNESRREYVMSSMGNGGQDRGFPVSQSSCGSASSVTHIVSKRMINAGYQLRPPDANTATPAIKAPTIQINMTRRLGGSNIVWLEPSRTTEHAGHVPLDKVHGHRV
jgi:hypothetical protein